MQQEVIITTKNFKVIDATPGSAILTKGARLNADSSLLDVLPELRQHIGNEASQEPLVCEGVVLGNRNYTMQVIPAVELITFFFQEQDETQAGTTALLELTRLRERNNLLEAIIEEAPIGLMLINEDGTIAYINKKQEQNSRKKRREIIHHDIKEVYRNFHDSSQGLEFYNKVIYSTEMDFSVTIDHYYPQFYKRDMIIKFLARRLKEHKKITLFVEIEDDLYREKRKAEKAGEELRMSQSYLAQLLDASPNMVISFDSKRRVVSFNKTAERLLGFEAGEVYNSPVDRFFPKEELPKIDAAVSSQVLWYGTLHIYRSDKSSFPIELYSTKIKNRETGKDIATLFLVVDIEKANQLRQNLIQSQKMNFIGELVSGLAHQLNNPLVGVVNIADMLLEKIGKDDEKYPDVKMIREAGESCKEVISRLLRFSRKQEDAPRVDVDMRQVLDAGIDMLIKQHPRFKCIKVERSYRNIPIISGDPVLLQQAFMNMLLNSAQASSDTGVIKVTCRADRFQGRQVVVAIADFGCGMPEEHIPRVFEPFFSTKKADDGTGIGLSLAYWIIQDHGGRISVESAPSKGAIFTTYLPATR